jgi:hypothetical protein
MVIFAHLLQSLLTDSSTLENAISLLEKDIKKFRKFISTFGEITAVVYRRSCGRRCNGTLGYMA